MFSDSSGAGTMSTQYLASCLEYIYRLIINIYIFLMGREEGKKKGQGEGRTWKGREEGQSWLDTLFNFQMRELRRLAVKTWHVQWVGEKELEWSSPVCTLGPALHSVLLLLYEFLISRERPFFIFCTSGAEPCVCYGPYVETCLSTASQMVPNSTQRIHLETFRGSAHFESLGVMHIVMSFLTVSSVNKKWGTLLEILSETCRPWAPTQGI